MSFQPAALTRMSIREWRLSTSAAQRRTEFGFARSIAMNSTVKLFSAASRSSSAPFFSSTSAQITVAPQRASSITVALPMPDAPPVTSAVLSSSLIAVLPILRALSQSLQCACEKCLHPRPRLLGGQQPARAFELVPVAIFTGLAGSGDTCLAPCKGVGRKRCYARGDLGRARRQFRARYCPLDDAQVPRERPVDDFGAQDEAGGHRASAQPGQSLRAAGARDQSEPGLGQAELHIVAGNAQIAGERELESAAHRRPANLRQRDLRQLLDAPIKALNAGDIGIHAIGTARGVHVVAHFLEVRARAEHILVRAQVQYIPVLARGKIIEQVAEQPDPLLVDGVDRRTAQGQRRDLIAYGKIQHGWILPASRAEHQCNSLRNDRSSCERSRIRPPHGSPR